jgi:uncharacterized membrane-anchored protein YhcB (DUF1043 family)
MALTKEDLQAIGELIEQSEQRTNAQLGTMQDSIDTLKQDMAHHNHYVEPLLKTVSDGIIDLQRNYARFDKLDAEVEDHDNRIFALEQAVKK